MSDHDRTPFSEGLVRDLYSRIKDLEDRVRRLERQGETEQEEREIKRKQLEEARAMGDKYPPTPRAHRSHLRKRFEERDLTYLGSRFRNGALMIFERPDGKKVGVLTYIVNKKNRFGQCSFNINHLTDPDVHWAALVAWPWRSTYLMRMSEITERFTSTDGKEIPAQVNVTIREGSPDADRFENRIEELVEGKL